MDQVKRDDPRELSEEERSTLLAWCASLGIHVDAASVDHLGLFRSMLLDWCSRMNLTAIRDAGEVLSKHFLDSLSIIPYVPEGEPVLDIGSGAGFPGLVLKMVRPEQPVTLVEATGKKVGFLEYVRRSLGLRGCEILHRRLNRSEADLEGRFEVVVSRGLQSPRAFVRLASYYLKPGGSIIAMLGRGPVPGGKDSEIIARESGCELEVIEKLALPEGAGTRHLMIFRRSGNPVPRGTPV